MGRPLILVGSVTFAMKGRDILARHGIRSNVERILHSSEGHGCGFAIYVPERTNEAEKIIRAAGIPVMGRADRGRKNGISR